MWNQISKYLKKDWIGTKTICRLKKNPAEVLCSEALGLGSRLRRGDEESMYGGQCGGLDGACRVPPPSPCKPEHERRGPDDGVVANCRNTPDPVLRPLHRESGGAVQEGLLLVADDGALRQVPEVPGRRKRLAPEAFLWDVGVGRVTGWVQLEQEVVPDAGGAHERDEAPFAGSRHGFAEK